MKVALCFSGKLGAWKLTRDSIFENVILPLKPDIFLQHGRMKIIEVSANTINQLDSQPLIMQTMNIK